MWTRCSLKAMKLFIGRLPLAKGVGFCFNIIKFYLRYCAVALFIGFLSTLHMDQS